jgi:hypothetical protein
VSYARWRTQTPDQGRLGGGFSGHGRNEIIFRKNGRRLRRLAVFSIDATCSGFHPGSGIEPGREIDDEIRAAADRLGDEPIEQDRARHEGPAVLVHELLRLCNLLTAIAGQRPRVRIAEHRVGPIRFQRAVVGHPPGSVRNIAHERRVPAIHWRTLYRRRQEAGGRRQEAGGRRQEAGTPSLQPPPFRATAGT